MSSTPCWVPEAEMRVSLQTLPCSPHTHWAPGLLTSQISLTYLSSPPSLYHCNGWASILSIGFSAGSLLTSLLPPRGILGHHWNVPQTITWPFTFLSRNMRTREGNDFVQSHTANQRQRQAGTQPCCPQGLGTFQQHPHCSRANL